MTADHSTTDLPLHYRSAPDIESLDHDLILDAENDPDIRDIIVFGPILLKVFELRERSLSWTIGMKGYRWSKLCNDGETRSIMPTEAHAFSINSIRAFRDFERIYDPGDQKLIDEPTVMDVDITVPTLLVVVSPVPNLIFTDPPITAKIDYSPVMRLGTIDQYCRHNPRRWSFIDNKDEWGPKSPSRPRAHVLTWISSYDEGEAPDLELATHNYNMVFESVAINSEGDLIEGAKTLPIIFDPGNNNGGVGNNP